MTDPVTWVHIKVSTVFCSCEPCSRDVRKSIAAGWETSMQLATNCDFRSENYWGSNTRVHPSSHCSNYTALQLLSRGYIPKMSLICLWLPSNGINRESMLINIFLNTFQINKYTTKYILWLSKLRSRQEIVALWLWGSSLPSGEYWVQERVWMSRLCFSQPQLSDCKDIYLQFCTLCALLSLLHFTVFDLLPVKSVSIITQPQTRAVTLP